MKKGMICNSLLIGIAMFILVACGTGDPGGLAGGGIGGTGISVGRITAIGSVTVNGVKFETYTATFSVDGKDGVLEDLEVGMLVAVEGTFNADGTTGIARSVIFKDNLEGPVTDKTAQTLVVMGQTVNVDATTEIYDAIGNAITLNDISTGNLVEVSGFTDSSKVIHATYIKVKAASFTQGTEIEIKGVISNLNTPLGTFAIGSLTVDYSSATFEDMLESDLAKDLFVEVKSTQGIVDGVLVASKVESEDEIFNISGGEEGENVEIEGFVTGPLSDNEFEVNGQPVRITSDTKCEGNNCPAVIQTAIDSGARLEVEGTVDANGVLVAQEISIESGDDSGESDTDASSDDESDGSGD
ncbi:MAG TPA: DUF5666 domain-containing protein [Nitrospirota bacterium]|nr:DUF5666 domain-containing protein [Nitrospirota bacterium]